MKIFTLYNMSKLFQINKNNKIAQGTIKILKPIIYVSVCLVQQKPRVN